MKINIPSDVYNQVMHWVCKANYEVSGFCKCAYNAETKEVDVYSAHLLKQEGGSAVTDIDAESLSKLMYTTRQSPGDLRLWWHSHVKMDAFWSGTDTATIKELGANGWCTAIVFNHRHEYKAAYCGVVQHATGETELNLQDDIDLEIVYPAADAAQITAWDAEFDRHVTEKTYSYKSTFSELDNYDEYNYRKGWPAHHGNQSLLTRYEEKDPGIAMEAAACDMPYDAYVDALKEGDPNVLERLDAKLAKYWNTGKLPGER